MLARKFLIEDNDVKVLLLSATPYKPYSTLEELSETGEGHYQEFMQVMDLLILRASRLKRGNPSLAIGRNPGCAHTLQWATLTLRSMRRPCRELRTSEAPSTPPSVHLCWQQHLSGKKDWTSITTAEKSCTGICHQTQLIWSNGKAGSTVISAMRSVRTWQTANSELSHLKRAFGRRPWIVRQWP